MARSVRYGHGILERELSRLEGYAAVVDPFAWELCGAGLTRSPADLVVPRSLELAELDTLANDVPDALTVVGIGGGLVMDAAKYIAVRRGLPLLLVPSITSSNAPFSAAISVRTDGEPTGIVAANLGWGVVVDLDLIGRADSRLNRSGFADLLAHDVALRDWRRSADAGRAPWNEAAVTEVSAAMATCRASARDVGEANVAGIELTMRGFERIARVIAEHPDVPITAGGEHLIAWNLEAVTGRHFVHGEAVALGIVVAGVVHQEPAWQAALDAARVRYRPDELGLSWDELQRTLRTLAAYNDRVRRIDSVLTRATWDDDLLVQVRDTVGASR